MIGIEGLSNEDACKILNEDPNLSEFRVTFGVEAKKGLYYEVAFGTGITNREKFEVYCNDILQKSQASPAPAA